MGLQQNQEMKTAMVYREYYQALKDLRMEVHSAFSKKIPTGLFTRVGKEMKVIKRKRLSLTVETDISLLMDLLFYNYPLKHRALDQSLIATIISGEEEPEDPMISDLYHGMTHARFSLFRIQETLQGDGCWLYDLLRNEYFFLHDHALSLMQETNFIFACNILPLPKIFVTSGIMIPFLTREMAKAGDASMVKLPKHKDGSFNLSPHAMAGFAKVIYLHAFRYGIMERTKLVCP